MSGQPVVEGDSKTVSTDIIDIRPSSTNYHQQVMMTTKPDWGSHTVLTISQ